MSFYKKRKFHKKKESFFVACHGKTELIYFQGLNDFLKDQVITAKVSSRTDPKNVAEFASKKLGQYDKVICIFDVDQFSIENIEEAISICRKRKIYYCISNPCFELWYLLHFKSTTRKFNTFQEIEPELTKLFDEKYDKCENYADKLFPKLSSAKKNSDVLDSHHGEKCRHKLEGNPFTDMNKIIKMFRFDHSF